MWIKQNFYFQHLALEIFLSGNLSGDSIIIEERVGRASNKNSEWENFHFWRQRSLNVYIYIYINM